MDIPVLRAMGQNALQGEPVSDRFFALAEDLFCICDFEGRLCCVNPAFTRILGLPETAVVGRLLLDFVHPEDRGVTSSMFEKLGQGRSVAHLVHRCLCSDDSYRWLIWNASPDLASGRIYACGRDHTDTRESEERLAQQLRLATLAAEVGVALTRHESLPVILRQCAEAIVRHLGAAFARIWVLNPSEQMLELRASAGLYTDIDGPQSRVPVGALKVGQIARDRKPQLGRYPVGAQSDHEWAGQEGMAFVGHPLIVADQVVGVLALYARTDFQPGIVRELASIADGIALGIVRKQNEEELQRTRAFLSSVVENLPIAVFIKEAESLRFVFWNKAGEELLGFSSDELAGKSDFDVFPTEDARQFTESDRRALARGTLVEIEEEPIHTRHRGVRLVHTRKIPIFDSSGRPAFLLGITADVTERRQAADELERIHRQLVEASRRAGMAEVATGVLHNVRNVLNSVNISATLVAEQIRGSKGVRLSKAAAMLRDHAADLGTFLTEDPRGRHLPEYIAQLAEHLELERGRMIEELNTLRKNIEHIREIVTVQQNYARAGAAAEPVAIPEILETALRINAASLARNSIEVCRELGEGPPVTVEKHRLLQIVVNLIRNAIEACEASSEPAKRVTLRVEHHPDKVRICVRDNGVGIAPENLSRVFHHGFTTKMNGHGFGLHSGALAVQAMGGTLTVHSDGPGCGAAFLLELPSTPPGKEDGAATGRNPR